ncbi:MAG: hypothetical protein AAGF10_02300 [Verrucomicrobiota bacterium]
MSTGRRQIEDYKWFQKETYSSLISNSHLILRSVFILNGGAILALLTFLGDAWSKGSKIPDFSLPLGAFIIGVILATIALGLAYCTQLCLLRDGIHGTTHGVPLTVAILTVVLSVVAFTVGSFSSLSNFSDIVVPPEIKYLETVDPAQSNMPDNVLSPSKTSSKSERRGTDR